MLKGPSTHPTNHPPQQVLTESDFGRVGDDDVPRRLDRPKGICSSGAAVIFRVVSDCARASLLLYVAIRLPWAEPGSMFKGKAGKRDASCTDNAHQRFQVGESCREGRCSFASTERVADGPGRQVYCPFPSSADVLYVNVLSVVAASWGPADVLPFMYSCRNRNRNLRPSAQNLTGSRLQASPHLLFFCFFCLKRREVRCQQFPRVLFQKRFHHPYPQALFFRLIQHGCIITTFVALADSTAHRGSVQGLVDCGNTNSVPGRSGLLLMVAGTLRVFFARA